VPPVSRHTIVWIKENDIAVDCPLGILPLPRTGLVCYVFPHHNVERQQSTDDEISLRDGSILRGRLSFEDRNVVLEHPILETVSLPWDNVRYLIRGNCGITWLADLQRTRTDALGPLAPPPAPRSIDFSKTYQSEYRWDFEGGKHDQLQKLRVKWFGVQVPKVDGTINVAAAMPVPTRYAVAYAVAYVHSDKEQTVRAMVEQGGKVRLWANGQKVAKSEPQTTPAGSSIPLESLYSSKVLDFVDRQILGPHDKNRNRILEPAEITKVPWVEDWKQDDANRDGRLTSPNCSCPRKGRRRKTGPCFTFTRARSSNAWKRRLAAALHGRGSLAPGSRTCFSSTAKPSCSSCTGNRDGWRPWI